jgi:DNA-binding response OmpR family regulator
LTAVTNEDVLAKCIAHGGDDFLTKPYNHTILRAKIAAWERIQNLHATVTAQKDETGRSPRTVSS